MDLNWTVRSIRDAVNRKENTATAIVHESLKRIDAQDGEIGAFLEVFRDEALAAARMIDDRIANGESLPLAGVPIAVKDNILVRGHIASAGSHMLAEYQASYTATVVARLQNAGAIIIGRTNCDEFAMGSSTESSAFQCTKNPLDRTKTPGGSSGGSCAAVAAGMVPASLGSDTGGSIRQPASLCGIVGMKPTYGRVSRYGVVALASSLDQVGPFARNVDDAALILSIIEGRDEHDATSVSITPTSDVTPSLRGIKIGVPDEFFPSAVDEWIDGDVQDVVRNALKKMQEAGAILIPISLPLLSYALPTYYILQPAEASSNLSRYDGMRYGTRVSGSLAESYASARGEGFGAEVKRRIMIGTFVLSAGYYDAYYKKALAVRAALRTQCDAAFQNIDVIVGPTSPVVAWDIGKKMNNPIAMYLADIYTVLANITGMPGISVPCGTARQLPVGLQILGKNFDDQSVLNVAAGFEALH